MNEEDKTHINSFKFYDRDELEELTKQYYLENKQLLKENEELKKHLEKKYEKVGTLTCELLYEENTRLVNEITVLKTENQKLKEMQCIFLGTGCQNKIKEYKIQQKEFIEYLENEIKRYRKTLSERPTNDLEYNNYKVTDVALEQIKIVLSKYKEIIGVKDE